MGNVNLIEKTSVFPLKPEQYRLAKKPDGTLVLQGACYRWKDGKLGHDWRDIPTVELEGSNE